MFRHVAPCHLASHKFSQEFPILFRNVRKLETHAGFTVWAFTGGAAIDNLCFCRDDGALKIDPEGKPGVLRSRLCGAQEESVH